MFDKILRKTPSDGLEAVNCRGAWQHVPQGAQTAITQLQIMVATRDQEIRNLKRGYG